MDLGLKGLKAFIAGGGSGLGYATALELANEGTQVAISGRNEARLAEAARIIQEQTGSSAFPIAGDLLDPAAVQRVIFQAAEALGGIDLLVTNAGGPPQGGFDAFDDAAWQTAIDLSLMSHVRLIRAALPYLRRSAAASVLTITSISVKQPITDLLLSNSVRLATIGLTKSLALEMAGEGIRFNSILPGYTETGRVEALMQTRALKNGTTIEEEKRKQAATIPLGRMARPDEFARTAVFLLSPAASFLTGVMLPVEGGAYKGVF